MSERSKLTASHLRRQAFVYVRQSTQAQLERNVESTERQYALVELLLLPLASVHERAGVRRVGQEVVYRAIARARPADAPLPDRAPRQLLILADQLHHDLARGAQPPPQAEDALDRVAYLLVRAEHDPVVLVAVEPDRQRQPQLAPLGLVAQPADQPRAD